MASKVGVFLLVLGVVALGCAIWLWHEYRPVEEPANPGKTPNPSVTPWTFDPSSMPPKPDREAVELYYCRVVWYRRLYRFILPPSGLLLIVAGIVVAMGGGRERPAPG